MRDDGKNKASLAQLRIEELLERFYELVSFCASQEILEEPYVKWLFAKLTFEPRSVTPEFLLREITYLQNVLLLTSLTSQELIEEAIRLKQTVQSFIKSEKDKAALKADALRPERQQDNEKMGQPRLVSSRTGTVSGEVSSSERSSGNEKEKKEKTS